MADMMHTDALSDITDIAEIIEVALKVTSQTRLTDAVNWKSGSTQGASPNKSLPKNVILNSEHLISSHILAIKKGGGALAHPLLFCPTMCELMRCSACIYAKLLVNACRTFNACGPSSQ